MLANSPLSNPHYGSVLQLAIFPPISKSFVFSPSTEYTMMIGMMAKGSAA